jgi:hypothetical protein
MATPVAERLDRWHLRKAEAFWARAAEAAAGMDAADLRGLRGRARALRRQIDRALHEAEGRLALPGLSAPLPRQPLGTDWAWRPDLWRGPLPDPGAVAEAPRTAVSGDAALYHDCPLAEVVLRQLRASDDRHRAPFGLALDIFGFRGSFLSLAMTLPEGGVQGLRRRHLVRVDAVLTADRPLRAFARLNIRHGPNLAQLVSDLPTGSETAVVEFDLAYCDVDEERIERAWLDLIFNDAAMTRIVLRDVVVSRRPRAEL